MKSKEWSRKVFCGATIRQKIIFNQTLLKLYNVYESKAESWKNFTVSTDKQPNITDFCQYNCLEKC